MARGWIHFKQIFFLGELMSHQNFYYISEKFQNNLTWVVHPDWLGLLAGFADPHSVTGPDPEAVFSLRLESWGHPERGALALGCELSPLVSRTWAFTNLHHVFRHSTAAIVRRPRPGQDQRVRGEEIRHRTGGRRLRQVWIKHTNIPII